MNYIYGPVQSRRLGRSLGVDPIPLKTCNWNCVYCQLGRTMPVTVDRREYFPTADIEAELIRWFATQDHNSIDWVSIVGSGEPTLHAGIGRLVRTIKQLTGVPLAVITNGSLLYLPEVREALRPADAVLPTLAAGSVKLHRLVHRPHPQATFERQVEGIAAFRNEYEGRLLVEVMLVAGLNDSDKALRTLALALERVRPDEIHITTPVRPPAESWVQPPDDTVLLRASGLFGRISKVFHPVELPSQPIFDDANDIVDIVVDLLSRHPISQAELERLLASWSVDDIPAVLAAILDSARVQPVTRLGTTFLAGRAAHFPGKIPPD